MGLSNDIDNNELSPPCWVTTIQLNSDGHSDRRTYTSIDNPFTLSNLINSYSPTGTQVSMIMRTILDIIHERKPFVQQNTSCSTLYVLVIYQIHVLYSTSTLKPSCVKVESLKKTLSNSFLYNLSILICAIEKRN